MKSKVEQYAKGDFYVEYPEIKLSKSYLQLKIETGSVYTGTLEVISENEVPMKMMVYDDAYLLHFEDHGLIGKQGEIVFSFDAANRKRGDIYEGAIHVIGNGTEKIVPYSIEIVAPFIDVNQVALEDLMKFCALAEENWNKALEIFYSEEFVSTLLAGNEDYIEAYRSLKASPNRNQALEEFLVYIHKKRALTLQVEHNRFSFRFPKLREVHELILHKNTWGYCSMKVSSDVRFITVHQPEICSMDFQGDQCKLTYTLHPEFLNKDKSATGHIILENAYQKIVLDILVKKEEEESRVVVPKEENRRLKKLEIAALMHNYLDYRIGLIPLNRFVEKTREALQSLISYGATEGIYKLGLLHMNILSGKESSVKEEMRRMEADMDKAMQGAREHCYYLYLKALLFREPAQIALACEELENALKTEEDKLFYFWLLIYLDERYQKDKSRLFSQIEGLYSGGFQSPVLALEICELINEDPVLLRKLSPVELGAIRFGLRNRYLSKEAEAEFLQLAAKEKDFRLPVFSLLSMMYSIEKKPDIIRIMCGILVKGAKLEPRYHSCYLEGIRCGYKIIGIQEDYLRSMDHSRYDLIPESVLRYFNYKGLLTESEYAYLYANVITNRRQYLNQYEEYRPNMESFMEEQIIKGAMSDDLCVLYSEFLKPQTVKAHYAASLVNVIFKRKLTVANDNIVSVVVSHKELAEELVVPVVNRVAYVDMVTESAVISLIDKDQNRYISTIPYKLQKLVEESEYMELLGKYAADDFHYALYQYDALGACDPKEAREVNIARDLLAFSEISEEIRQQAIYGIVRYYHTHLDRDILKCYLNRVDMAYVSPQNGTEFINYLLECEFYEKAYDAVKRFGYQGVKVEYLIRLAEIMKEQHMEEETLISIAAYLYRMGQETPEILGYLVDYYQSGIKDMLRLWKRAQGRLVRLDLLEENILCETLYTEQWNPDVFKVFEDYVQAKQRGMVIKAFYKRAAFAYLAQESEVPASFFDLLYQELQQEETEDDILCAAMLLYFSTKIKIEDEEIAWIKRQTERFVKRGILLPFFRSFKKYMRLPKDLFMMTYVVTKDKAGKQISFRYGIQSGIEKPECNKMARMMEVLPGYYVKEFVLFHGENLLYEMPEKYGSRTWVYESEGMKAKGRAEEYENRFEMLNSMLLNQEIGENKMLFEKLENYLKLSSLIEENLEIME